MSAVWGVIALGIVGTAIAVYKSWRRDDASVDMGAVSHQWIAEHRLGSGEDLRR